MIIDTSSHAFKLLKLFSQAINPALAIALVVGLVLLWRKDKTRFWAIFAAAAASIAISYLIKNVEGHNYIWAHWGMDFSSHSALAIACCTAMAFIWQRRWWIFAVIFVAYAIFMIMMQFHTTADILSTSAVIFPICLACQFVAWRWQKIGAPIQS
jgi:hypothetical protein